MNFPRSTVVACFVTLLIGCSTKQEVTALNGVPAMNAGSLLTPEQLKQKKALAKKGDQEAIGDLYGYYSFGRYDQKQSDYWLKRDAFTGEPSAEYNYGKTLYEGGKKEEGLQWIKKSAEDGFYAAPAFLAEHKQ